MKRNIGGKDEDIVIDLISRGVEVVKGSEENDVGWVDSA